MNVYETLAWVYLVQYKREETFMLLVLYSLYRSIILFFFLMQGAYNLSCINEDIIRKTQDKVYWDEHRLKDYERDLRVSTFFLSLFHSELTYPFISIILSPFSHMFHLCPTVALCSVILAPPKHVPCLNMFPA
jgi:hypothetical protein